MSIVSKVRVSCPGCGAEQDCEFVQSINTKLSPALRERLLKGELNFLACACGERVRLASNLLFHDPDAQFLCQVVPAGNDAAMTQAASAFHAMGATGTLRLVRSEIALIEKVKIREAGFEDWVIELAKVLLLASLGGDLDRVVLFERAEADSLVWVMFDGAAPTGFSTPRIMYDNLRRQHAALRPTADELRIDRVWVAEAMRRIPATPK